METITLFNKRGKNLFKSFVLLFCSVAVFGQVEQSGTLFIGDSGVVSIFTTPYNFGVAPAISITTRTEMNYGKLYFSEGTSWTAASNDHYLDGYVSTFGNANFTFPVGDRGELAPARLQDADLTTEYDCAYYWSGDNSFINTPLGDGLVAVSELEYWHVQSTASKGILSLAWSARSSLGGDLPDGSSAPVDLITIAGWNGTEWVQIPSVVDANHFVSGEASDLKTSGSITSTFPVDFSVYSKFTFALKDACAPLVDSNGEIRKWNGAWVDASNVAASAPTLQNPVIIEEPYNAGSFVCNALQLDADITLTANQNIEVVNGVSGTGKIIMASNTSVVQRASGVRAPNIELTKTREGLRQFDYVYYGTPVAGDFFSDLATAKATNATEANAFDRFYEGVTGANAGNGWAKATATKTGFGFIARVKPAAPFVDATTTDAVSVVIDGVANNGDINLTATNDPGQINGGRSHVLLGNPYPSPIDGLKFIEENTELDGVIYVWTSGTSNPGLDVKYNQADYLAFTKAGTVATSVTGTFDGVIPSGQGFKVKILPTNGTASATTANIVFNNCMRMTQPTSTFYKSSAKETATKDRFKLNMTGSNGVFSQILVAYLPETTLGYDRMYDAGRNSVSTAQLYSILGNEGTKLSINARPSFFNTDVVPLGISKNNTDVESFVINIAEQEGIFANSDVKVYLHDKIANTYHDFSKGGFTFTTSDTKNNDRFEIVYQTNAVLSTDAFTSSDATVVLKNNILDVKSLDAIKNIYLFDVSGRLIEEYKTINANTFKGNFNHEESIYFAKISFENGTVISKKLIHTK